MVSRTPEITSLQTWRDPVHIIVWSWLLNGDDGVAIEMPGSSDRSIQFAGTFGTGGTIQIEGSNNGSNYVVLTDPQGNNISKTTSSLEMITELTRYIRPRVTAGDGTTNLASTLLVKLVK